MNPRKSSTRSLTLAMVALLALGYGLVADAADESEGEVQSTTASATAEAGDEKAPEDASELGEEGSKGSKSDSVTARPDEKYSGKSSKGGLAKQDRWAHTKEMEAQSKRRLRQALLALDLVQARLTAIKAAEGARAKDMKASEASRAAALAARGSRTDIIKKHAGEKVKSPSSVDL